MTVRECAIIEAYTGCAMLPKDKRHFFYEYLEELSGRPVRAPELTDPEIQRFIQAKSKPDFIQLCMTIT